MLRTRTVMLATILASLLAPRAYAAPVVVTGQVVDAQGKPVTQALVTLAPPVTDFASRKGALVAEAPPEPAARALVEAGGRFRVAAPGQGMWLLRVSAPGFVTAEVGLYPLLDERDLGEIRLEKSETVAVRVLGPDGRPLAGAVVRVRADEEGLPFSRRSVGRPGLRQGTTDAAGTVALPRARGESLELAVSFPGLMPAAKAGVDDAQPVELRLAAGCARRLEVRDAKGAAVAGALVSLKGQPLGATDAAGALAAALPCQGKARLAVETAQGYSAELDAEPVPAGASAPPLRFTLAAPLTLTGRVLDALSRAPLAGAFVWPSEDPAAAVQSDGKGGYALVRSRRAASPASLWAAAREHRPGSQPVTAPPAGTPARAAGPTLALQPVVTLAGQVVDAKGAPVAGAAVTATESASGPPGGGRVRILRRVLSDGDPASWRARTDAAGAFRLEVLPRKLYTLRATHADFAPASLEVAEKLEPGSSRRGLRIVLPSGLAAHGQVVSAAGSPVAGATVELVPATEGPALPFLPLLLGGVQEKGPTATSDAQGQFRFDHLPAGRFDMKAEADGFASLTVRGLTVPEQGGPLDLGTLTLAPGVTLDGVVVDARGKPVPGVAVSAAEARGGVSRVIVRGPRSTAMSGLEGREVRTLADGSFSFRNLTPDATFDVSARKKGLLTATASRVKVPPAEPLRLVMQPAARLSGRVVDDQGSPVAQASVGVQPADGERLGNMANLFADTDADGNFVFETLEPGKVGVRASARGFLPSEARYAEVATGREVTGVELVVKRGAVIEGVVITAAGAPAAGAQVGLQRSMSFDRGMVDLVSSQPVMAETDGDGQYRLEGVPEGAQSVAAELSGHQRAVRDLEVRPGANRLDLRLGEGLHVTGRVVDAAGSPVAGARVSLSSARVFDAGGEEVTGADGAFRFTGLSAGGYQLAASKQGYTSVEQSVQIAEAPVDGVELRLARGGGAITGRILGLDFGRLSRVQVSASKAGGDGPRLGQVNFEGQYRIEGVSPGDWRVNAVLADGGRRVRKNVTVPEGGGDVQLDIVFEEGLTLSGRVTRAGAPVDGAAVSAFGLGVESSASSATDSTGAFRLEGLKAGKYRVSATQIERGMQRSLTVDLDISREIEIEMPVARVSGRAIDATSGAPLAGVLLRAEMTGEEGGFFGQRAISDNTGSFTLEGLAAGNYRIHASKEGFGRAEKAVDLPSDEASVAGVEIALEPEAGLVLDVTTSAGGPPPSVWISLLDGAGQARFTQLVAPGENGRTRVRDAPAGSYRILVAAEGFATTSLPVTIPGDPVAVRLPLAARLTVTVRELAETEQEARLTLVGADGQPFRSPRFSSVMTERPLPGGTAEIDDLPAGTWQIRVVGSGKTWEDTVTVREGEAVRKEL